MPRKTLLAAALALAAFGPTLGAWAQSPTQPAMAMQPGQRVQTTAALGDRVVRNVMISEGGGGVDIVYDMPAGATRSQRVLRLENVNGMLEVIYDSAMPASRPLATGGTPKLTAKGGGMYEVTYDK